jgi:ATP-dependent exoDNAse (exonuclease V) alpha subunit
MAQEQGGAADGQSEAESAQARERAHRIAAQRAAADAAIAAVAGGRQALAAMTSAAAAAARSAGTVETKRTAERVALKEEETQAEALEELEEAREETQGEGEAPEESQDAAQEGARPAPPQHAEVPAAAAPVSGLEPDPAPRTPQTPQMSRTPEPDPASDAVSAPEFGPAAEAELAPAAEAEPQPQPQPQRQSQPEPEPEPEREPEQPAERPRPVRRPRPLPASTRALGPAQPLDESIARWIAAEGAPASFVDVLRAEFGEGAEAAGRLTGNPWLILELPRVQPAAADNLAGRLLGAASPEELRADPRRSRALVTALLRRAARLGHTALNADAVARDLGGLGVPDPAGAIADAVEHGAALVFADRLALAVAAEQQGRGQQDAAAEEAEFEAVDTADDDDPETMLTSPYTLLALDRWAFVEQSAAEAVQRLLATAVPIEPKGSGAAGGLAAAEVEQLHRVVGQAAETGLTLVTGGGAALPGLVAAAFPGALLASPSPAGLRTLAAAGHPALDLRALAEDTERFEEAEVVVVADAQLLPLELGVDLMELLPDGAHLVLCGDSGSLPATGPGRLFRDLLEIDDPEFGGSVPRVELKRRPSGPLSALVEAVRYGGLPPMEILGDGQSNEVKIIPVRDPAETRLRTVQLVADSIPRALDFSGGQVQAIAMREQGPAGAEELNAAIKERLTPGPGVCAGFDAGDRVIMREGAPLAEYGLYGGETGTVLAADAAGLTVRLDSPALALPPIEGTETSPTSAASAASDSAEPSDTLTLAPPLARRALRHAWVLTLREAQGGHWPAVVAVLDGGSAAALTRAAVLGAFAPAEQHLSVVHGAGGALAEAVEKRAHTPCRTRLAQALRG